MTIFQCSDTLDGILCGVYDAWMSRLGHGNAALELEGTGNLKMFTQYRKVEESRDKEINELIILVINLTFFSKNIICFRTFMKRNYLMLYLFFI